MFKLGGWGLIINILALVWGGFMIVNFALWSDPQLFGSFGSDLRDLTNPSLTGITSGGNAISWLPDVPFFEGTVLLILVGGIVYYLVAARGRDDVDQVPDLATGEATIG